MWSSGQVYPPRFDPHGDFLSVIFGYPLVSGGSTDAGGDQGAVRCPAFADEACCHAPCRPYVYPHANDHSLTDAYTDAHIVTHMDADASSRPDAEPGRGADRPP